MDTPIWPADSLFQVTPSDTVSFSSGANARQLYVGVGGDVTVLTQQGAVVLFKNVASGSFLAPFRVVRVNATNTTATNIIAFI